MADISEATLEEKNRRVLKNFSFIIASVSIFVLIFAQMMLGANLYEKTVIPSHIIIILADDLGMYYCNVQVEITDEKLSFIAFYAILNIVTNNLTPVM